MYKRPARILFVEAAPARRAGLAVDAAHRLGRGWLQGRAACLGEACGAACPPLDEPALAWADLVVTFDAPADRACAGRAKRCKHWSVDAAAAIDKEVASMVGGLRMLARSDPAAEAQEAEERGSTGSG